jgi:hypothetical protein
VTSFDQESYEANKSLIAVMMGHFFLRYLNRLYREFDGDLILPIVLGEIAHHNITKLYSSDGSCLKVRDEADAYPDRMKHLEPTNAYSISQATGIPRETVRRKIDKLVKKGWILKNSRGGVAISETVADHFTEDFNKKLLADLLETSECIREILEKGKKNEEQGG